MKFALNLFPLDIVKIIYCYCVRGDDFFPIYIGLLSWAMILRCSNRITYSFTSDDICSGFDLVRDNIKKYAIVISHIPRDQLSFFEKKTMESHQAVSGIARTNGRSHGIEQGQKSISYESHNDDDEKCTRCFAQQILFFDREENSLKARKKSKTIVPSDNFRKSYQKNTHCKYKKTQCKRKLAVQKDRLDHDEEEYIKTIPIDSSLEEIVYDCSICSDYGCRNCGPYYDSSD